MPPERSAFMLIIVALVVLAVIAVAGEPGHVAVYMLGLLLGALARRPSRSP